MLTYICRLSEYLIWQANKQGLPITIYRPGMISWSMKTGKGNNVRIAIQCKASKLVYVAISVHLCV